MIYLQQLFFIAALVSISATDLFGGLLALVAFVFWFRGRQNSTALLLSEGPKGPQPSGAEVKRSDLPDRQQNIRVYEAAFRFPRAGFEILLVAYALWFVLSFVMTEPREIGWLGRLMDLKWFFLPYLWALAWVWIRPTTRSFRIWLGLSLVVALYGIFQHFTGWDFLRDASHADYLRPAPAGRFRSQGFQGNPITFGNIFSMLVCVSLAWGLLLPVKKRVQRFCLLLPAGCYFLAVILSVTRGVWIAVALASLFLLWQVRRRYALAGVLGLSVVVGLLAMGPATQARLKSTVQVQHSSNQGRLSLWRANLEIIKDHPVFGVGYGQNRLYLTEYYDQLGIPQTTIKSHAHNQYLHVAAGTGLPGVFLFTGIFAAFIFLGFRLYHSLPSIAAFDRALALGAASGLLAFCLAGVTEANFEDSEVTYVAAILVSILLALNQLHGRDLISKKEAFIKILKGGGEKHDSTPHLREDSLS